MVRIGTPLDTLYYELCASHLQRRWLQQGDFRVVCQCQSPMQMCLWEIPCLSGYFRFTKPCRLLASWPFYMGNLHGTMMSSR